MRKLIGLLLVMAVMCSLCTVTFATTSWENGTDVSYLGDKTTIDDNGTPDDPSDDTEIYDTPYTVTVPKLMAPGGTGDVVATGSFPSTQTLVVDCDDTVLMNHTLAGVDSDDDKTLDVTFTGISLAGNNEEQVTMTKTVSVADITDALFGQWHGHFDYDVDLT